MLKTLIFLFFYTFLTLSIYGHTPDSNAYSNIVVIDPGHGGKDPGTHYGNLKEKDLVLDIALLTGKYINEKNKSVKVIYTRKKDQFISLNKRAEIANKNNANLFISIHANYFGSSKVSGAETFVMGIHNNEENLQVAKKENSVILLEDDYSTHYEGFDPTSVESYIMFETIQNEFLDQSLTFADTLQDEFIATAKRRNRGVKQAGFWVLRKTTMPSVLVEVGFLSNVNDRSFLKTTVGKEKIAESIANAYLNYMHLYKHPAPISITQNNPKNKIHKNTEVPTKKTIEQSPVQNKNKQTEKISSKNDFQIIDLNTIEGSYFSIQIAALKEPTNDPDFFKGLKTVYYCNEAPYHKYYYGLQKTFEDIKKDQASVKQKFKGSFIVGIKNGVKVNAKLLKDF